jgi:ribosomal subunit interface protein
MEIAVTGKHLEMGEALTNYVHERMQNSVKKFFEMAISSDVVFSKEGHLFHADITVNEGTGKGIFLRGSAQNDDIYTAFDGALIRIEKQLRKYKEVIKSNKRNKYTDLPLDNEAIRAKKYVISNESDVDDNPIIIAEKATDVVTLSVSQAVMKMDLMQLPALLFRNVNNNRLNVVYHRADGNISWVDPQNI